MIESSHIWNHLDQLTKPPRSLGKLEELAARLCEIQRTLKPKTQDRRLVLFAGDHGVVESGVTAWPSKVTELMIENIHRKGSASAVLAEATNTELSLIDIGSFKERLHEVSTDWEKIQIQEWRVRRGTRNLENEPALTVEEFEEAYRHGRELALKAKRDGNVLVACGEMGIGNTTPAACLSMLLADVPLEYAVGRGAGADDAILQRKRDIVKRAVDRARGLFKSNPTQAIASVCGLEIAGMAGFWSRAAEEGMTLILDGYVVTAAALIAEHFAPGTAAKMIAAHLSAEPGHRLALGHLNLKPFLEWDLRLGEGTGALLLFPLLDAASAMVQSMATFQDLGIQTEANL